MNTLRYSTEDGSGVIADRQVGMTPRKQFLRYSGLQRDVFSNPVAEQEYGFSYRPDAIIPQDRAQQARSEAASQEEREKWLRNLFPNQYARPEDHRAAFQAGKNGYIGSSTTAPRESAASKADNLPVPQATFSPRSFFVDPLYSSRGEGSIFKDLRRPEHTFLFGRPGEGKTTTRLALEAHVRAEPEQTLMMTYEPGRADTAPTRDDHLRRLIQEAAVDLFVQVVEQFAYRSQNPSPVQTRGMVWLLPFGGQPLRRVLDLLVDGDEPSSLWGFAELWRYLDRPIVRPVVRGERLQGWLTRVREQLAPAVAAPQPAPAPRRHWARTLRIIRHWGFEQVYLAVDGVDVWQRTPEGMMDVLDGLLAEADKFGKAGVYLKGFLPLELQQVVETKLLDVDPACGWRSLVLDWRTDRLAALLYARFRAGGSGRLGLGDLAEGNLEKTIDAELIEQANDSPRRLLTRVDQLINLHVRRGAPDQPISQDEWQEAGRRTDEVLGKRHALRERT